MVGAGSSTSIHPTTSTHHSTIYELQPTIALTSQLITTQLITAPPPSLPPLGGWRIEDVDKDGDGRTSWREWCVVCGATPLYLLCALIVLAQFGMWGSKLVASTMFLFVLGGATTLFFMRDWGKNDLYLSPAYAKVGCVCFTQAAKTPSTFLSYTLFTPHPPLTTMATTTERPPADLPRHGGVVGRGWLRERPRRTTLLHQPLLRHRYRSVGTLALTLSQFYPRPRLALNLTLDLDLDVGPTLTLTLIFSSPSPHPRSHPHLQPPVTLVWA